uniref:Uncharacterized protein n=1 Tax=viral metagenome TaxID=1070528 RepID=A0A6C0H3G0_9ZZZZ
MYTEIFLCIVVFYTWRSKTHLVFKDTIVKKVNNFRRLNSLVATTETGYFKIAYVSLKLVAKASYISFIQYMNNSVKRVKEGKAYELTYVINGRLYKMITNPIRGPVPILQISNDDGEDVTDIVLPYMGPQYDWHYREFSPSFFGYKSLTFELSDGTERTYEETESFPVKELMLKRMMNI